MKNNYNVDSEHSTGKGIFVFVNRSTQSHTRRISCKSWYDVYRYLLIWSVAGESKKQSVYMRF